VVAEPFCEDPLEDCEPQRTQRAQREEQAWVLKGKSLCSLRSLRLFDSFDAQRVAAAGLIGSRVVAESFFEDPLEDCEPQRTQRAQRAQREERAWVLKGKSLCSLRSLRLFDFFDAQRVAADFRRPGRPWFCHKMIL
jgi:hypothetical protein